MRNFFTVRSFFSIKSIHFFFLIPLIYALVLVGCVSLKVYSQVNPEAHPLPIKKIFVVGNFQDIVWQNEFEDQACQAILANRPDLKVFASSKNIFQGYRDKQEMYDNFISKNNIPAVLVIKVKSFAENSTEVQARPEFQTTTGKFTSNGYGIDYNSMTTTHGGEVIAVNKTKFLARMDLIDTATKVIIWTSEGYVSTSSVGPFTEDGVKTYAYDSIYDLFRNDLFGTASATVDTPPEPTIESKPPSISDRPSPK